MSKSNTQQLAEIGSKIAALKIPEDASGAFSFFIGYVGMGVEYGDFNTKSAKELLNALEMSIKFTEGLRK